MCEAARDPGGEADRIGRGNATLADAGGQRRTLEVLHCDPGSGAVAADVVHVADVGMMER
jgi:hypothetical protein